MRTSRHWIGVVVAWLALWPGLGWGQTSTSFTFHAGATSVTNGAVMSAANFSTIIVQIEGTFVGTVQFEKKTKDASGYVAVQCTNAADRTLVDSSTDSPGYWECPGGAYSFRVPVTSRSSGTIIVTGMGTTAVASKSGGGSVAGVTLGQAFTNGRVVTGATTATPAEFGNGTQAIEVGGDATLGGFIRSKPIGDSPWNCWATYNCVLMDRNTNNPILTINPLGASPRLKFTFNSGFTLLGSVPVTLYPRGAASYSEASIVSNQPKSGWIQITDADTDAVDFRTVVTGKMAGATTATVRLYGVSDHASPSGNIVLNCDLRSNRPGTDTYAALTVNGSDPSITLTPATQNRPVSAVTSVITINGTVAEFAEIEGACHVNASSTTSAQLTDFFLRAEALVQLSVNSWSD